ncbi:hypothetical protein CEXT_688251 [Caerostris extrusa]|uniref:Uncharacterized protein n=1 Tax=Caerostris extrusa TaxID=172846 RepID=A0AAV4SQ53_CAEEX|nr:hypothetical protein CEXT_688251 [Caerostris extrusa]
MDVLVDGNNNCRPTKRYFLVFINMDVLVDGNNNCGPTKRYFLAFINMDVLVDGNNNCRPTKRYFLAFINMDVLVDGNNNSTRKKPFHLALEIKGLPRFGVGFGSGAWRGGRQVVADVERKVMLMFWPDAYILMKAERGRGLGGNYLWRSSVGQ